MIQSEQVTGLVLAGGRGSRMGGLDKGLACFRGEPMAKRALGRLMPQVGPVLLSANRNLEDYAGFGVRVVTDTLQGYEGPLAGFLAGWSVVTTRYLQAVPCDVPNFPTDLVVRLLESAEGAHARLALPVTQDPRGLRRSHPVFLLMRADVREGLDRFVSQGGRRVEDWARAEGAIEVVFPHSEAFFNVNTLAELEELEGRAPGAL